MKKGSFGRLAALSACLAAPAFAGPSQGLNFDQGIDAGAALERIRAQIHEGGAVAPAYNDGSHYSMDCVKFEFKPEGAPVSQPVTLRSTEWITHCPGRGLGGGWPHHNDPWDRNRGGNCVRYPGQTYTETVQVTLRERKPLNPWESDTFQVCLEGPWLRADPVATGYEYRREATINRGDIAFSPGKKIPMRPDPAGLSTESLSTGLNLKIADKWASYYPGERTVLWLWLVQEWGPLRPTILDTKIYLPSAPAYEIDLMKYSEFFNGALRPGSRYFVKYSFAREGAVSKPDWVPSWGYLGAIRTETIVYQPGSPRP